MDDTNKILDSTLNVVSNSITTFDDILGHVPLYKSGHNVGGAISNLIDTLVDAIPFIK